MILGELVLAVVYALNLVFRHYCALPNAVRHWLNTQYTAYRRHRFAIHM